MWFSLVLIFAADSSFADDECKDTVPEVADVCFSVDLLKASQVALKRFQAAQPKADQKHFHVLVREFETYFEINFLADTGPIEQGVEGDTAYIVMPNPHGNQYGRNVGYEVSKESGKILKTFYSK